LTKAEEVAICTNCPLAECVQKAKGCPLWRPRSVSAKQRKNFVTRQTRSDRKQRRGYWPEIHGTV
jgi:hypothetical protein